MVANDLVDAFDHFNCHRTHFNHHSVEKMPKNNPPFNRKHEVEFGLVVTDSTVQYVRQYSNYT